VNALASRVLPSLLLTGALAIPLLALAQTDTAVIGGNAGRNLSGRGAINEAAGQGNTQANVAALALTQGGQAPIDLQVHQHPQSPPAGVRRDASVRIEAFALSNTRGLLSVNQVAGSGNAQLNLFALGNTDIAIAAPGLAGLDDAALAAVAADPNPNPTVGADASPRLRQAVIADDALRGSQGVVQVNQTAGVGNFSTNAIVLQLPGSAP
jgi:hypothetical protein